MTSFKTPSGEEKAEFNAWINRVRGVNGKSTSEVKKVLDELFSSMVRTKTMKNNETFIRAIFLQVPLVLMTGDYGMLTTQFCNNIKSHYKLFDETDSDSDS